MPQTNVNDFVTNLQKFCGEIMKTKSFEEAAFRAGDKMKQSVINKLRTNGNYSFIQSGQLLLHLKTNEPEFDVNRTGSKATIGYAHIDDFNQQTKRKAQVAVTPWGDVSLRPEPSLPSWIIVEFGRRSGSGSSSSGIPEQFTKGISYTPRDPSKNYMAGPFSTLYHLRKPIFFMTNFSGSSSTSLNNGLHPREHPGIHEGRIFRDGLKNAKEPMFQIVGEGLFISMKELSIKYGGTVERS